MGSAAASPAVDKILDRLDGVKPLGTGWRARCPAHKDNEPSLKIDVDDTGKVLLHCYVGCSTTDVVTALGLTMSDLFPPREQADRKQRPRKMRETKYAGYDAESGELIGHHIRHDFDDGSKRMWWQQPNGVNGLAGYKLDRLALYGADRIGKTPAVVVTEGEKARDALTARRIAAVGTMTGAEGLPCDAALRPLLGRLIVLWPDRDDPGEKHMTGIAERLRKLGQEPANIRRLAWLQAPPKSDAADWPGTDDDLRTLIEEAPAWVFVSRNGKHDPSERPTAEPSSDNEIHLTDLGNARRLVRNCGEDLRYCKAFGKWFIWDGSRFADDATDEVVRRAKSVVMAMYPELATVAGTARDALYRHAKKSEQQASIRAMLASTQSEPGIPVTPDELDQHPWLLNTRGATIDLREGRRRDPLRSDLITRIAPIAYDPTATCPNWEQFLASTFAGDTDLIGFVQRALGYSLTGVTRERVVFILYGSGRNGKTTLLNVVQSVLGKDYADTASPDVVMTRRNEGIPNDIAALKGRRFVVASESAEGRKFDEARVKQLSGSDRLSARFMRGEFFTFEPEFKLWLCTNHKPVIKGTDEAIWDRIRLIPFGVRFWKAGVDPEGHPALRADEGLETRLMAEAPGILAWMAEGCIWWQRDGLGYPKAVRDATLSYRQEMDRFGEFIEDRCAVDESASVTSGALYAAYRTWALSFGDDPMTSTSVGLRLRERGFVGGKVNRERGWLGLRLVPDSERVEATDKRYGL